MRILQLVPRALLQVWLLMALPFSGIAASLPEVVERVLQQHPDIRSSQALLNASSERIIQARSNYYPIVGLESVAADASDIQFGQPLERTTRRNEIFVRWNLFRGMADWQSVSVAQREREASIADLGESHERVALQVSQIYIEVLRLRGLLALGDAYLVEHRRLNEEIGIRAKLGKIPVADVEYSRNSLIQAELQQSQMRGELAGVEQFFRLLVGTEPDQLIEPVMAFVLDSVSQEQLLEQMLTGNRLIRAAQQRAVARGNEVGVAAAGLYPSLDLEVRQTLSSQIDPAPVTETDRATQFQLRYQLPLGGGSYSRKREAVQRKLAAQAAVDTELIRLQSEVTRLWSSWNELRVVAPRLEEWVEASYAVVNAYDLQFSAARRTLIDLISARGEHYRAQVGRLNNRLDQSVANIQILSMLGQLRQSLLEPYTAYPAE